MTTVDAILAIAGLLRDFAAVIVVVTGILAFISEVVGLLSKKQPRLDRRILEKGLIGFDRVRVRHLGLFRSSRSRIALWPR